MAYTADKAIIAFKGMVENKVTDLSVIDGTKSRGYTLILPNLEKIAVFIYPLVHKEDNTKNYFDTRDSGAYERAVTWNYALSEGIKYFCLGVNDSVDKYIGYVFSLECDEKKIAELSGINEQGQRNGPGNQIIIPNDYIPSKPFERIKNRLGVYLSAICVDGLISYLTTYDNRPYLLDGQIADLDEYVIDTAVNNKAAFKAWMGQQVKANGEPYSENTINSYISQMERGYTSFEKYHEYDSVFQIQSIAELDEYTTYLFNADGFDDFNDRAGNKACSCGLAKYKEFILENTEIPELCFHTGLESPFSRNRILFGAPGTGKSFTLNNDRTALLGEDNEDDYERVTFHPDYSYANFVGTYKPVPHGEAITYEYVPGPFMRVYVNALKNGRTDDVRPFLLIVEEINRANVAAVFGDIFQLLDRDDDEVSEYPIQASEDIKKYLAKELGGLPEHYEKIKIPDNMFIWATMNSADQGVFPMDTAFKRRWDFTYISINSSEAGIAGKTVTVGTGTYSRTVEWNALRRAINERLSTFKINEDKLLGPYFLSKKIIPTDGEINPEVFIAAFKNKVLMYLFDDAAKQKRPSLFAENIDTTKYSAVCEAFDEKGVFAFCTEISNRFPATTVGEAE